MPGQMEAARSAAALTVAGLAAISGAAQCVPAQKHRSEPLMIVEPEISFGRRDAAGADPRGAVISSADTERLRLRSPLRSQSRLQPIA
jgi:hypothetical protein